MKPLIIQILEERGLKISEDKYLKMQEFFDFINLKEVSLDKSYLEENAISLKNISSGDHIDE